jgi:hypothetical protein
VRVCCHYRVQEVPAIRMFERHPTRVLYKAVKGMLPRNLLRHARLKRLKLYSGPNHPHVGQFQSLVVRRTAADGTSKIVAQASHEPYVSVQWKEQGGRGCRSCVSGE